MIKKSSLKRTIILVGLALIAIAVFSVVTSAGTSYDLITNISVTVNDGAIFQYFDTDFADGTGNLSPYLRVQNTPNEAGYNSDDTSEAGPKPDDFNMKGGKWTHPIKLSEIPSIVIGDTNYLEFIADFNEANSGVEAQISIDAFEIYLFKPPSPVLDPENITGYPYGRDGYNHPSAPVIADPIWEVPVWYLDGHVLATEENSSGSGQGDIQILVPVSLANDHPECYFGSPTCNTYLVNFVALGFYDENPPWQDPPPGVDPANWETDATFEEIAVRDYFVIDVSKTLDVTYEEEIDWTLTKDVTPLSGSGFAGDQVDFEYTVTWTPTAAQVNYRADGEIVFANNAGNKIDFEVKSITDTFNDVPVEVTCPENAPFIVAAKSSVTCTYSVDLDDPTPPDGGWNNSVEVEYHQIVDDLPGPTLNQFAEATDDTPSSRGTSASSEPATVTITDDNDYGGFDYDWLIPGETGPDENIYTNGYLCPTDSALYAGDGVYSFNVSNTADIVETDDSDSETVTVTCYAPVVSKDVTPAWEQDFQWDIFKNVDNTTFSGNPGDGWTFNYDIDVDLTTYDELNFSASGTINVVNPHPTAAMVVGLTDAVNGFSGVISADADCAFDGTNLTIPAGGTATCDYTVDMGDVQDANKDTQYTNTATTTIGGGSFSGTATFMFNDVDPSLAAGSEPAEVTATDDNATPGDAGDDRNSATITGTTQDVITYSQGGTCPTDANMYTNGVYEVTLTNIADIDQTTDTDTETVTATCYAPVVSKNVTPAWEQDFQWDIFKNVDSTTFVGFAGDAWAFNYDIDVDLTTYDELNFSAAGTISVQNPDPEDPMTVALTDSVNGFSGVISADADCAFDGANLTIPAGSTATCDYTVDMGDVQDANKDTQYTNTATAMIGGGSFSGTATFMFNDVVPSLAAGSEPAEVTATDDNATPGDTVDDHDSATITGTTQDVITYSQGGTCPTDANLYTNGVYEVTLTNIAVLDQTDDSDTETVTITCYFPAKAKVVKTTTEGGDDIGQFPFTFELYDPDGALVETKDLNGAGEVTFDAELKNEGTWTVIEILPDGWVSTTELTCTFDVAYPGSAGQTHTCTFDNVEKSRLDLLKLTNGLPTTSETWSFAIYEGPDGFGGTLVASQSTPPALLDFGNTDLNPFATYSLCELGVPSDWTLHWQVDVDGDGIGDTPVVPYNPDADADYGNRCVDFGANTNIPLVAGETLHFVVDNQKPGVCVVIIDEETIDNDISWIEYWAGVHGVTPDWLVNDDRPTEYGNPWLRWNLDFPGDLALLPGGEIADEGWFALPDVIEYVDDVVTFPFNDVDGNVIANSQDWVAAFVNGTLPQDKLDKVKNVMPLRNPDLLALVGQTCVAVVYDSNINMDYDPLYANLQGARYGLFAFTVEAVEVPGSIPESQSSTSLYDLWLRVERPTAWDHLFQVTPRDQIDSVQTTRARYKNGVLTVWGTSDLGLAEMWISVDGADAGSDPNVDPFILDAPMTWVAGPDRFEFEFATPVDLDGRRITIYTTDGAYNVYIE